MVRCSSIITCQTSNMRSAQAQSKHELRYSATTGFAWNRIGTPHLARHPSPRQAGRFACPMGIISGKLLLKAQPIRTRVHSSPSRSGPIEGCDKRFYRPTATTYLCQTRYPISAIEHTLNALIALTKDLSIGTNLDLLHILWMRVSGTLLAQLGQGEGLRVRARHPKPCAKK